MALDAGTLSLINNSFDSVLAEDSGFRMPGFFPDDMSGVFTGVTPPIGNTSVGGILTSIFGTLDNTKSSWPGNILNGALSGIFKGLSVLSSTGNYNAVYNYYNKQQAEQIANGIENARRAQLAGDIALAKLRVSHALNQGSNELAAAAAGGRLSGSALDKLVANYRFNQMDERTQQIETLWEVNNRKRQGYLEALSTSFSAMGYAHQVKQKVWDAAGAAMETTVSSISKDVQAQSDIKVKEAGIESQRKYNDTVLRGLYGSLYKDHSADAVKINDTAPSIGIINYNYPNYDLEALNSIS